MIGGAKGIGLGIDLGLVNQYNRTGSQSYIEPEVLDSLVGVWSAYGMTNDSPNRSTIKNKLSNKGGDFVISNAAFKLNSGFGKYSADFESFDWAVNISQKQHNKATISLNGRLCNHTAIEIDEMKVNIIGNVTELIYWYIANPDDTTRSEIRLTSGINTLPKSYAKDDGQTYNIGFAYISGDSEITIEQIPSFEGAFVTDGIDDLITSTKTVQEMLGGSTEFTAVSMIHLISPGQNVDGAAYTNYIRTSDNYWTTNRVSNTDKTGIYGYSFKQGTPTVINNILGDKNDYTTEKSNIVSDGSVSDLFRANFSVEGFEHVINGAVHASSVAWYWTIIANKVLTTDQINQVIAYFNLDRTLKSDIYCNIAKQGITNDNHAEFGDKLIDFSGNGRDIQLNNIAWKGDSGIGKYEVDFLDSSIWNSSNSTITSSKIDCKNAISHIMLLYYNVWDKEYPDIPSFKVIKTGADIDYSYIDETGFPKSVRIVDGVNILPASHNTLYSGSGRFCGFGNPGMGNSVTITQIPSHAGGLCLDGINDFGKVTGMPVYKDYTFIIDRQIISIGDTAGIVASKSENPTDVNKQGAFLFEYLGSPNNVSAWSFCKDNGKVANTDFTRGISYQSKYSYNGTELLAGTAFDSDKLWLGTLRDKDSRFANVAIYSLMSFPYSMSKFLIERQLKKHKLGTLYPDMVEFRPIVKSNNKWNIIEIWQEDKSLYRPAVNDNKTGIYLKKDSTIGIYVKPYVGQKVSEIVYNGVSYTDLKLNSNGFYYKVVPITKSPQKITMTIEQDENYVKFEPVITSNVEYVRLDFYLNNYQKRINIGDYIPKDAYLRANFYLKNNVDELTVFTFNGVNIGYRRSSVDDTAFNINQIYNYDSPQEVNITIDEYIRYEDIVQPYPVLLRFNDENGNEVSWGGKFKVGSTITRIGSIADPESNLLNGLYSISGLSLNGKAVTSSTNIVEKQMVFRTTATWLLDNNEPKVILSPSRLRIPNSSYKLLGYIPDISGHGNNGVIHNSAYAEGSGVNEDGSYQFDGVDDFITIPTTVGGKQVFMKVNWNTSNDAILYDQRNFEEGGIFSDRFAIITSNSDSILAYSGRNTDGKTYIDGILNANITCGQLLNITHNITALAADNRPLGKGGVVIGASKMPAAYCKAAVYDFMLFDEISTDDKIKELNEYVGVEAKVELPPYYWDTYGKTNFDEDRATIQQRGIAKGDYDLTNYNHAYDKMSGYGGYEFAKFDNTDEWTCRNRKDGIDIIERNAYSFTAKRIGTGQYFYDFQNRSTTVLNKSLVVKAISNNNTYVRWEYKYRTAENPDVDSTLLLVRQAMTPNVPITVTLPYKTEEEKADLGVTEGSDSYLFYFDPSDISVGEEYTVEMLPLYPNGLAYDGVEDYSENVNVPIIDDFTFLVKASLLKGFTGSGGLIARKGDVKHVTGGGYAFVYCLDSSTTEVNRNSYFSFGKALLPSTGAIDPPLIGYMTKTSVNGVATTFGTNPDIKGINFGDWNGGRMSMVVYKSMLYPKTIPLLQINFLKNLMEKDEIIDLTNPIFIQ